MRMSCLSFNGHPLLSTICQAILPYLSEIWRMTAHLPFSCIEISVDMLRALVQSFSGSPFWLPYILNILLSIGSYKFSGLCLSALCLQQHCLAFFGQPKFTAVLSKCMKYSSVFSSTNIGTGQACLVILNTRCSSLCLVPTKSNSCLLVSISNCTFSSSSFDCI